MQCRFRWWCKWIMNRVPVATSPALDAGRILHCAFEEHFKNGTPLADALAGECASFRNRIPEAHPSAIPSALKAVEQMEDLIEAMPLWEEKLPIDEVLEVEQAHEWEDPKEDILWLLRPDRVAVSQNAIWHEQNRGLAAGMNFGTYVRLGNRHYHEHLYAEVLASLYRRKKKGKKERIYGGTWFNLVRKLKYRTYVGKKNETTKSAEEMFWQGPLSINLNGPIHASVMMSLRQHVRDMRWVERQWQDKDEIPAPNEKLNGGFSGSSEDPFFKVLIGEVSLNDPQVFKDRQDTYTPATEGTE